MARLRTAVRPFPPAMLFELAAEGHDSAFEVLVACMISIRTRDETSLPGGPAPLRPGPHPGPDAWRSPRRRSTP